MSIKHFRYISKTKIEMLDGQLPRSRSIAEINPKITVLGTEIGLGIKSMTSDNSLAKLTVDLSEKLRKRNLLIPLEESTIVSTMPYYLDTSMWHNGLVTWGYFHAYMVIKSLKNKLIMLIGSSNHLIGNNNIERRHFCSGNTEDGLSRLIQHFVRGHIEIDNTSDTISTQLKELNRECLNYPLDFATYCREEGNKLPCMKLEVAFKIYHVIELRKCIIQATKAKDLHPDYQEELRYLQSLGLFEFSHFYVGAPLYTAIV